MNPQTIFRMREQLLEGRIKDISLDLDITVDKAFMHLVYAILFDTDYFDSEYDNDVVDGGGDKQIDIIKIEESDDSAMIHLVQVKNSSHYSGTTVVLMKNALSWILQQPEDEYMQLTNQDLAMKIINIRHIAHRIGYKKMGFYMHYIAKGDGSKTSPDFDKEVRYLKKAYADPEVFKSFEFKVWGINELIERSDEIHQQRRSINIDIPIYVNPLPTVPSYLEYTAGAIKSVICTIRGIDLASIINQHQSRIFEENVRNYLGQRKSINEGILKTCSNSEEAEYFWFFNNGITVTCDSFDIIYSSEPPIIKIMNMQIVNGCQTSMTLKDALDNSILNTNTKVLLKIYATKDDKFVDKITFTTNNQNVVTSRDLCSNDQLQRYLVDLFKSKGYYYERKPRMFNDLSLSKKERKKLISNERVGQSHLAIVGRLPATAMAQRGKIWSDTYYKDTFGSRIEELLASYLISAYCLDKRKKAGEITVDAIDKAIVKYGNFHLARIIGSLELGEHWHGCSVQRLTEFIGKLEQNPDILEASYEEARIILRRILEDLSEGDLSKIINIFKSKDIQEELNKRLKKDI